MSSVTARRRWLVPVLGLLVATLLAGRVWVAVRYDLTSINEESLRDSILLLLSFSSYLAVGLVLLARRPDHPLGWVLSGIGLLTVVGTFAESYSTLALAVRPDASMPGAVLAAWIQNWYWYPLLALMFLFVPLLFPTGRPLTPRWRWLHYAAISIFVVITVTGWMKPTLTDGSLDDPKWSVRNPIGVEAVGDLEQTSHGSAIFIALLALAVCALVSLIVRFRRSRDLERQQMKLFVFAGALMVCLPVAEELGLNRFVPESNLFFALAVALPPAAIGVAVLRYRLYDIDRLISRTLSYALLTALLVALYLAVVTALTTFTAGVAGNSPVAVAAATLLTAAAFGPARRRIQAAVDRRFNRTRYDAQQMVAGFAARMRDEVDLDQLSTELHAVSARALEPSRALLWLRESSS